MILALTLLNLWTLFAVGWFLSNMMADGFASKWYHFVIAGPVFAVAYVVYLIDRVKNG